MSVQTRAGRTARNTPESGSERFRADEEPRRPAEPGTLHGLAAARLRGDVHRWSGAGLRDAEATMASRAHSAVAVIGLDRCGMAAAFTLAAAGIGRIVVAEEPVLRPDDLGTSALRLTELGLPRGVALARHLGRLYPHTRVQGPLPAPEAVRRADAVLVVASRAVPPELVASVRAWGRPTLPVVFTQAGFRVGPLSLPAAPGCEECRLEAWGAPDAPAPARTIAQAVAPETTSAVLAAGLAAQAIVMAVDSMLLPSAAEGAYVGTLGAAAVHFEPLAPSCVHPSTAA